MNQRSPLPPMLAAAPFGHQDARAAGVSAGRLRAADLRTPFHGVRTTRTALESVQDYCAAYAPRLRPGQFFSHTTAALLWNLPVESGRVRPGALHVSARGPTRAPSTRGVRGHSLRDDGLTVNERYGHPVVDIDTAWCQCAALVSFDELIAAGDAAVHVPVYPRRGDPRPFTTVEALELRVTTYRTRGKRLLQRALPLLRTGAESPRETMLRLLLVRSGLPEPELNVDIYDGAGVWAGRADLFYPRQRVAIEYDGDQHRRELSIYENDQIRLERLADAGCRIVRVRSPGLGPDSARTVARVTSALRAGGYP